MGEADPGEDRKRLLARFLTMALRERADEFGIKPDREGYVHLMDLMGVILDEPDLAWVTVKDVGEAVASMSSLFEISGSRIRAVERRAPAASRPRRRRGRGGHPSVQPPQGQVQAPAAEARSGEAGAEKAPKRRRRRRRHRHGGGGGDHPGQHHTQ